MVSKIPDTGSRSASKNKVFFTQKTDPKFSNIRSGMYLGILDLDFWIPDPGLKKAPDPSATLLETSVADPDLNPDPDPPNRSICFSASRIRIHLSEVWLRIRILSFSFKGAER
jgi:hypothetical protein